MRVARSTSVYGTRGSLRRRRQKLQLSGSQYVVMYVWLEKKRHSRKKKTPPEDGYSLQPCTEQSSDMPAVMLVISGRDILFCLKGEGLGKTQNWGGGRETGTPRNVIYQVAAEHGGVSILIWPD